MSWLETLAGIRSKDFSKAPMNERDKAARDIISMCSYACAAVSISPIPFSDVVLMVPIQSAMVMTVGHVYGRKVTSAAAENLILELGATVGVSFLARQGIKALLPVVGALLTVPAAFAANWGIGRAALEYFKNQDATKEQLRRIYEAGKREGESVFSRDEFDKLRRRNEADINEVVEKTETKKATNNAVVRTIEVEIPDRLRKKPDLVKEINALLHLDIGGASGGKWTIDLTKQEDWVVKGHFGQPKMTLSCDDDDFVLIASGQKSAQKAVLTGALRLEPLDMELAQAVGRIFTA